MHGLRQCMAWAHTTGMLVPGLGEKLNFFSLNRLNDLCKMCILHTYSLNEP